MHQFFKVEGIPMVVVIGANGETVTTKARELILSHGAEAYPFTEEHVNETEAKDARIAEGWPKKVTYATRYRKLVLNKRQFFKCDGCGEEGRVWSYCCEESGFVLHPKCALRDDSKGGNGKVEEPDDEDEDEDEDEE